MFVQQLVCGKLWPVLDSWGWHEYVYAWALHIFIPVSVIVVYRILFLGRVGGGEVCIEVGCSVC